MNWRYEGHIIDADPQNKHSSFYPARRMDRPHILKNHRTGKYVLWLKFCDKNTAMVLTADHILGPYTVAHEEFQPYGKNFGDFDLAQDKKSGEGYLFFEANHDSCIGCHLSSDYCDVSGDPNYIFKDMHTPFTREGITHFEKNGKHYILSSGMTGYIPNPSECAVSNDFLGPYRVLGNPHVNDESSASFNSQISSAFQIEGTDVYVAVADRWVPDYKVTRERYEMMVRAIAGFSDKNVKRPSLKDLKNVMKVPTSTSADTSRANYVWLPIHFEDGMPRINWTESWNPSEYITKPLSETVIETKGVKK